MNHELLSRALKACPVIDEDDAKLTWCADGCEWRFRSDDLRIDFGHPCTDAHNAMTARWLGWLCEQHADPLFPSKPSGKPCVSVWIDQQTLADFNNETMVEAIAAAVLAVSEADK